MSDRFVRWGVRGNGAYSLDLGEKEERVRLGDD
jgi:hypothetical protein